MVRNYVPKTKEKSYSDNDLCEGVRLVKLFNLTFDQSTIVLTARYICRCFGICTEQSGLLAFCQALRLFLKSPYWSAEWKKSNHHMTKFIPNIQTHTFSAFRPVREMSISKGVNCFVYCIRRNAIVTGGNGFWSSL